jgi:adenosylcobinamide kinase/adenosylcobinamide-phosphate guanylyltransferase
MGKVVLILGGARSGKTRHAMQMAKELAGDGQVVYLATAEAGDEEMAARITRHRRDRPAGWRTVEAPREVTSAVEEVGTYTEVIIVDCITLWVSNLLLAMDDEAAPECEDTILTEVEVLAKAARGVQASVVLVSNEVGLGIVPATPLGRIFRDVSGRAQQLLAQAADEVYVMWAGLPQRIK